MVAHGRAENGWMQHAPRRAPGLSLEPLYKRAVVLLLLIAGTCNASSLTSGFEGKRPKLLFAPVAFPQKLAHSRKCSLPLNAFKFRVVTISKTKEKWCETACDDYGKRVRKFGIGLEEVVLKPAPGPPKRTVQQQREEEGRDLLSRLDMGREALVVLDERGEMLTSHQFADYLQNCADDGIQAVTFAIGGANGHSEEVQKTARQNGKMISFGKMVMNHQIARVVLFEQLYRALTIQRGVPYHK